MPPKPKYTREEVIKVAFEMTREMGFDSVTTRGIGKRLGTSATPIFTLFKNMHEVQLEVRKLAMKEFENYVADALTYTPAFKQFGVRMIEFATKEPKLFQILYMQEHEESVNFEEMILELGDTANVCMDVMQEDYELTKEEAEMLFKGAWLHTFSICVLVANKVCHFSQEQISQLLGLEFQGELVLIKSGNYKNINPAITS